MAIQDCIEWIQDQILATMTYIKSAPDYPTDTRTATPTAITYANNIRYRNAASGSFTFSDIYIEITRERLILEDALKWLEEVGNDVNAIFAADPTMGGNCATYNGDVTANLLEYTLNGMTFIGYKILVPNVKILR